MNATADVIEQAKDARRAVTQLRRHPDSVLSKRTQEQLDLIASQLDNLVISVSELN